MACASHPFPRVTLTPAFSMPTTSPNVAHPATTVAVSSGFKREAMPIEESRCPVAHPLDPHAASWGQQVRVVLVNAPLHLRTALD